MNDDDKEFVNNSLFILLMIVGACFSLVHILTLFPK